MTKNLTRCLLAFTAAVFLAPTPSSFAQATREIRLLAGTFDPLAATPARRPRADALDTLPDVAKVPARNGARYFLVQFHGPVLAEWQQALRDAGAEPLRYVPDYAFITRMQPELQAQLRRLPFVRFVGPYKPEWRVHPNVLKNVAGNGFTDLSILVQPGESIASLLAESRKQFPFLAVLKETNPGAEKAIVRIPASQLVAFVRFLADRESLGWIERWIEPTVQNNESIWVIQSGTRVTGEINSLEYATSAPIWAHDILGTGQLVTMADSGLTDNDCFFSPAPAHQNIAAPGALTLDNALRKVVAYNWLPGGADNDSGNPAIGYHGSHVAGTILGDSNANLSTATSAGHNNGDGMAPHAKLIVQDIGGIDNLGGIPNDLRDLFAQAYTAGSRIHSNSWGAGVEGEYTANSFEVDDYNYRLGEDMLIVFAASNDGAGVAGDKLTGGENDTIGSPGTAKNALTVGALKNGADASRAQTVVWYSSRGNTDDGRTKPDITAPGDAVVSHFGDATACNTTSMGGTSMATPTIAGAAALARQYFTEGWYPSGTKTATDGFAPTAAALKAVLTAGARALTGDEEYCSRWSAAFGSCGRLATRAMLPSPNSISGWGRATLIDSLWFATAPTSDVHLKLWDVPNAAGVTTGTTAEYTLPSVVAGTRLHINLVWSDPPGTLGAAKALVNDLNLEVIAPNGTTIYRGNQWAATANQQPRESAAGAAAWDNTNNLEGVQIAAPAAGNYRVRVRGLNVPGYADNFEGRQGYAIAATGNFTQTCSVPAPTGLTATATASNQVTLSWTAAAGATSYAVYRSRRGEPTCGGHTSKEGSATMTQIGQTNGTTFVDNDVVGGHQYSYFIKSLAPCDGAPSNCATVTATGSCTLKPTFGGLTSAATVTNGSCGIALAWSAGTSNCPLGATVRYNVYRSTTPNFTPTATDRIASCVSGTSYVDAAITSGITYHYVVRAEDSTTGNGGACGGNEEMNAVRRSATGAGTGSTVGTWTDGGGDTTAQLTLGGVWSIVSNAQKAGYARTGSYAYKTSPGTTPYPSNYCADARTPNLSVAAGTSQVRWWSRHDFEFEWDGLVVEYSTNGGTSWTPVTTFAVGGYGGRTFTNAGNSCGYPTTQGAFQDASGTATLTTYAQHGFDVPSAAGGTLMVRWRASTDAAVEEEGFVLDDVSITNVNLPNACLPCTTPGVPTGVAASAPNDNTLRVDWSAGSPAGATYNVYRATSCAGTFSLLASNVAGLTYDDIGVPGGTTYAYKVTAVDSTGGCESAQSSCVSATATGGPGRYSRGKFVASTPTDTTGTPVKWIYSTAATAMVPPGIGSVFTVSNDRVLHGTNSGLPSATPAGGTWPAGWKPFLMNAASQARPGVPSLPIAGATKLVFLGAQDGHVYAVDANSGAQLWRTVTPLGDMIQGAIAGLFSGYGGAFDLLVAPTRNSTAPNAVYGLDPSTGAVSWMFDNGGGAGGIGVINGDPWIDYGVVDPANNKVYFASRKMSGGSSGTVWCLDYTASSAQLCAGAWPAAIGDIDGTVTLYNGRVYVGTNPGSLYALDATTGAVIWNVALGDGPIKGFVDVDFTAPGLPYQLNVATTGKVWAITDNGPSATVGWNVAIAAPSIPLFNATALLVGSGDGRLYEITNLNAVTPTVKSVLLGDGSGAVGSPSFEFGTSLAYVGTESGKVYAVQVPLP